MLDLPIGDFDSATRAFQVLENKALIAGMIVQWPGATTPKGWLACDGSTYNRVSYPALSRVIGGSGSTFTVPNISGTPGYIIKA